MRRVAVCLRLRYSSFQAWFICLSFKVTLFLNVLLFGTTFSRWQAGYESWPMSTWVAQRNLFPWKILKETVGTKPPSFYCFLFLKWGSRFFTPDISRSYVFAKTCLLATSFLRFGQSLASISTSKSCSKLRELWSKGLRDWYLYGMSCTKFDKWNNVTVDVSRSILP